MLNEVGTWYRITDLAIDDDRLQRRRAAARELVDSWDKSATADLLLGAVSLTLDIAAPDRNSENGVAEEATISAMIQHQPSLDKESSTVQIDARICCGIAVGEFLARRLNSERTFTKRNLSTTAVAAALLSGLSFRPRATGAHLEARLAKLLLDSVSCLDSAADRRRSRPDDPLAKFTRALGQADPESVPALRKATEEAMRALCDEMLKDREELNTLWWLFGGVSWMAGQRYREMEAAQAAIYAAAELNELTRPPTSMGIAALAARALAETKGAHDLSALPALLGQIDDRAWPLLSAEGKAASAVRRFPNIFPMHYVALRRSDTGLDGALGELARRTEWPPDTRLSPANLAIQSYLEKMAIITAGEVGWLR